MTRSCAENRGGIEPPSHCNSLKSWRRRLRRPIIPTCSREKTLRSRSTSLKLECRCGSRIGERSGEKRSG